ncbi:hypothetical protein D3C74_426020 [compost metagenome]
MSGIGRQGLYITALSFSVDRIERQRRFAGAAKSRQHDEAVTRNRYVNVLEIVRSRTFDYNIFVRQRYLSFIEAYFKANSKYFRSLPNPPLAKGGPQGLHPLDTRKAAGEGAWKEWT